MKLASLRDGGRDGTLVVVARDLSRYATAAAVAPSLQHALDHWDDVAPALAAVADALEGGGGGDARTLRIEDLAAPLPRAYQWIDGSAYLSHMMRVREARGTETPASAQTEPLMYQGGSDSFLGSRDAIAVATEDWGADFESEVAVVTADVPMGASAPQAARAIRLVMLANDVSLRNLVPAELAKGFGFLQSKPSTAFSPFAVTPDELGAAWDGHKVSLPLLTHLNGEPFGRPNAGVDLAFDFPALIAHAAAARRLAAGTIIGSGTVSDRDGAAGSSCIAERRALETIAKGAPITPDLRYGDRVRIEMLDDLGNSVFGAIEQVLVPAPTGC